MQRNRNIFHHALFAALLATSLAPASLHAELPAPLLVGDFTPGRAPHHFLPEALTAAGGRLYFRGSDPQHGEEPWVSDGTPAGTRLLADLCPGSCPSFANQFTELGDQVLFYSRITDVLYSHRDGQLHEVARGIGDVEGLQAFGDRVYFRGGAYGLPRQMWQSDGTPAGTRPTEDFCNAAPCYPDFTYAVVHGRVYFAQGGQLAAFSTPGSRVILAPLWGAHRFTELDAGRIVFVGCPDYDSCAAWVSDGTAAGTFPLEPVAGGTLTAEGDGDFVAWRGRIYFANDAGQLVSTDGTPAGTRAEPSFGERPRLVAANSGHLLYTLEVGEEYFLHSRGAQGADQVLNATEYWIDSHGQLGETIFFESSLDLYLTDGTPAGTQYLAEAFLTPRPGAVFEGRYYFGLDPQGGGLPDLWSSNGTVSGTGPIDLGITAPLNSFARTYSVGGALFASLPDSPSSSDLFRIDPQTFAVSDPDPRRLHPLAPGRNLFYTTDLTDPALRPVVVLRADGPASATLPAVSIGEFALAADDHLFFTGAASGQELAESDGTAAGTRTLFDLLPGYVPACSGHHCEPDYPQEITPSGDRVFFVAPGSAGTGSSLWVWRRGSATLVEVRPYDSILYDQQLDAAPGNRVVFFDWTDPADHAAGISLWRSDGTPAGTRPFLVTGYPRRTLFVPAGNRLYFEFQEALWVSDLTEAGTQRLIGGAGFDLHEMVAAGDHLFFTGKAAGDAGPELGFSDGTAAGTYFLDLKAGPSGSYPTGLYATQDQRVVFAAAGDAAGDELWISDGTLAGTGRLTDLAPGAAASSPGEFAQVGGRLFFRANDGVAGYELWALDLPPAEGGCLPDRLCLLNGRFLVQVVAHTADGYFPGRRAVAGDRSGVFSFFSADNWELMVKVLDGCALNGNFWVFGAAATDAGFDLTVTDLATGRQQAYQNTLGQPARALTDTAAFTCP